MDGDGWFMHCMASGLVVLEDSDLTTKKVTQDK